MVQLYYDDKSFDFPTEHCVNGVLVLFNTHKEVSILVRQHKKPVLQTFSIGTIHPIECNCCDPPEYRFCIDLHDSDKNHHTLYLWYNGCSLESFTPSHKTTILSLFFSITV